MQNFWKAIKEHNTKLLASQIRGNGGTCEETAESVIENLSYLAEKGECYGEETRFLRLNIRRALGTLCDTGRLVFKPSSITWTDDKKVVTVGGYLYEVREDGNEIVCSGYSVGGAALEDVYSQDMMSDQKRTASQLSLAAARAESNAYFSAGIGIEFKGGDVFDLEAMEQQIKPALPKMPSPVSQVERKAKAAAKKAEKAKAEAKEKELAELVNVPEGTPVEEALEAPSPTEAEAPVEAADTKAAGNSSGMSFEDAKKVVLDCGNYAGKTIGEILAKKQTARAVVWVYKQDVEGRSQETKDALLTAINTYDNGWMKQYL